jgi:hypothetical protein
LIYKGFEEPGFLKLAAQTEKPSEEGFFGLQNITPGG